MPNKQNTPPKLKSLSPKIHRLLATLRSRIRWFVLLEGIATAIGWLLLAFWIAFALDYLPVLFGFRELSQVSRAIVLVVVTLIVAAVLYRLVFRRVFVRLKDRSLALLVERRYPQFNDSLLTTVGQTEAVRDDVAVDAAMLEQTKVQAESFVAEVDPADVVNSKPLKQSLVVAGLLLVSLILFGVAQPTALKTAGQRLFLLQEKLWPRRCRIEIVGIKVKRENPVEGIEELGQTLEPINGGFRVAKGSTLTLMIRAEGSQDDDGRRLPTNCKLIYSTEDGGGTQAFKRIGVPRDGFQLYSLDGQPLRGILKKISFEIRGGDHRIGPFEINVVDEPDVLDTKLACEFPEYIVDEESGSWMDRTIDWTGRARFPVGTNVTIKSKSNNELRKVYVLDRKLQKMDVLEASGTQFEYVVSGLEDAVNLQFFLCDQDGLIAEQPHTINIEAIEDQPPIVQTRLTGIGTAITPDVQIPIVGSVSDEYGLSKTWVEIEVAETETLEEPITVDLEGGIDSVIDFKQRATEVGPQYKLPVDEGSTVQLVIKSEDKFDLAETPNMGVGDRYTLDVVTPNQLVRILERLEVGQRRRLEQIYLELADARSYLVRTKSEKAKSNLSASDLVEPGENESEIADPVEDDGQPAIRKQELRLLFAQRSILQIDKSIQEILGSAEAFDNIRLQLINNRIDSEDRKNRFSQQIIAPLRLIGGESMQQLKESVIKLEVNLRDLQISPQDETVSGSADRLSAEAIEYADMVLNQLDAVLNVLIKYETQNELLEIVRRMIKQQQDLKERTKKERQRKAFEGLLD